MKDKRNQLMMIGFRLFDGFVRFPPGPTSEYNRKGVGHDQEKNPCPQPNQTH